MCEYQQRARSEAISRTPPDSIECLRSSPTSHATKEHPMHPHRPRSGDATQDARERVSGLVASIRWGGYVTDNVINTLTRLKVVDDQQDYIGSSIADLKDALLADRLLYAMDHGRHISTDDWEMLEQFLARLIAWKLFVGWPDCYGLIFIGYLREITLW